MYNWIKWMKFGGNQYTMLSVLEALAVEDLWDAHYV